MNFHPVFYLTILVAFLVYYNFGLAKLFLISCFGLIYLFAEIRHKFAYFPLYLITMIQGRNFKLAKNYSEIKYALKFKDKGKVIEELFATPAWDPIISLESTNGTVWENLRSNFLKLVPLLPSGEKLGEIASREAKALLDNQKIIDSEQISKSTFKVFLTWLFCENHNTLGEVSIETNFEFINGFLTQDLLDKIYKGSLEYRKEIAIKGKGDDVIKRETISEIVNILIQSKFNSLFDWSKPENYSVIMQPFIVSPMINISDIAVSLKNSIKEKSNFTDEMEFIDHCLFNNHPFPILERYDESSNTQYFIDLRKLNEIKDIDGKTINFGLGFRSCLGRTYAREFMKGFFTPLLKENTIFQPEVNHLYSGRDNDNINFTESLYQFKILVGVLFREIKKRILNKD